MSLTNVPLRLSRSAMMYLSPSFSIIACRRDTEALRMRRFAPVWRPINTGPSLIAMTVSFNLPVIAASRGFIQLLWPGAGQCTYVTVLKQQYLLIGVNSLASEFAFAMLILSEWFSTAIQSDSKVRLQ